MKRGGFVCSFHLSTAAMSAWAKHDRKTEAWLPLYRHMADSGAVAGRLWDDWVPGSVKRLISHALPEGESDGRILVTWLAASHDLGKATPVFAMQVPELADRMEDAGLPMPSSITPVDRRSAPHSLASHVLLRKWLTEKYGWAPAVADAFAVVPGGHHGVPPSSNDLIHLDDRGRLLGKADAWLKVHDELADFAADSSCARDRLPHWATTPLSPPAQALVTGIVILADWIASNHELFPYGEDDDLASRTERGLDALALPGPWRALAPPPADELFSRRFDLPDGATARPVQLAAYDVAATVSKPGLIIVEAPMGEGKTEAALAAAEVLAHRTGAGGCFIALPTMATSDAMFTRALAWTQRLPRIDGDETLSVYLAHSKSRFNEEFRGLMDSVVQEVGVDECSESCSGTSTHVAVAHQWLFGRKKGVLADVVIGTIDQILFGALKTRHLALRHLAMANKVVIIDEVHAVDTYMSVYLDRVIEWLGAYRIPTIVLSATLPSDRRRHLVESYDRGSRPEPPASPVRQKAKWRKEVPISSGDSPYDVLDGDIGYPVITASTGATPMVRAVPPSGRRVEVRIEPTADDDAALVDILRRDTAHGGCVAIIRNTVGRAQQTKELLEQYFPGEVTLIHSRFLAVDRSRIEADLRSTFGRDAKTRPGRHFVVGTQVLEQSLDVDFDLMVTDLAPIDLLLQRMGRLHRHNRPPGDRPPLLRTPRCLITGVEDWSAQPILAVDASQYVYGSSALLRSVTVLGTHLRRDEMIALPEDIAPLVQSAYSDALQSPPGWEDTWAQAEREADERRNKQLERAADFLLASPPRQRGGSILGWINRGAGDVDDSGRGRAQVRDTDDGIEVVVVQRVDGELRALSWLDEHGGRRLDSGTGIPPHLARAVATCTVRLPPRLTSPWMIDRVIDELETNGIAAWQDSPWLGGELVLVIDAQGHADIAGHTLEYDRELGLLLHNEPEGAAK
ncbi:CRISPR-associated helicase Cas3' [Rhodococcus sp. ABRD24]|uniref:CRISPR-associated helicase Cas3' n=1 Tax=Rhodococcus sp. ABRD24 TaxID=2507582 RepID=UPI00103B160D|nr:CRISPR-associated helicase Cas3' [Rhodococcus sp. ABRD24]QBJ97292.1 CRISPR-associated helicase Cas3' [Rhodococcus sp. ABRD24]